ncbi:PepSY-like domain-containing protein [Xylanibacter muris]|uniref:PepSY-like domain-containing protein n=1 Tax=Xylanibacter muris TaxID=2736290 RepID=A0ABX2ALS7_9BACT|nr:PepSY-like domain-containing protein [Xylanibacter muris]NPD92168.1 PepSY-like domain-containing protein [Xylanibacter muris]
MRKVIMALVCLITVQTTATADTDKIIDRTKLPAVAQQIIKKHFKGKKVAAAKMESNIISKNYDVIFTNGDKIEFDKNGNWTEIDCKRSSVPAMLVPTAISKYVKNNYSGSKIIKIEKDKSEYEIELSTGTEITFNKHFQVTDID